MVISNRGYMYIKRLICKIKGHKLTKAGSCPFTGLSYDACTRCNSLLAKQPELLT